VIVVSDTSPIANLVVVGYIDLLPQLFGTVVIPEIVYQELLANGEEHLVTRTVTTVDWLEIRVVNDRARAVALERDRQLDPGEANAIVLARELNATQLLIDERLGRLEAKRQGLRITGILGVLLAAKRQGRVERVRPILDALINEANFWISSRLYSETLALAGESSG
jgi:predicted nucleic acid-binding protein